MREVMEKYRRLSVKKYGNYPDVLQNDKCYQDLKFIESRIMSSNDIKRPSQLLKLVANIFKKVGGEMESCEQFIRGRRLKDLLK